MKKKNLQPKIILLFFIISTIVLIVSNIFSYVRIKEIYEKSLVREFNDIKKQVVEIIDNKQDISFKTNYIFNNGKEGYLFDSNFNLIEYISNEEITEDTKQEIIERVKLYNENELINKERYEYKVKIDSKTGESTYYLLIYQDKEFINNELKQYAIMMCIMLSILLAITLITSSVIIQNIMQPIKKLSRNLDEIIEGKTDNIKNITNNKVSNEIYDLADKFKILAQKLNDNLQEISSQKAQTETILLHMSDGVMAFDTFGNLIYKNPSAVRLLDVDEKET